MPTTDYAPGISDKVTDAIKYAIGVAEIAYSDIGKTLTVTSTTGGKHQTDSLHYSGNAADIRTKNLTLAERYQVFNKITTMLGRDYDVIDEQNAKGGPHIHIEYQPRSGQQTKIIDPKPIEQHPDNRPAATAPVKEKNPTQAIGKNVSPQFRSAFILGISIVLLAVAFIKIK